jgi:hypothetical protein
VPVRGEAPDRVQDNIAGAADEQFAELTAITG